MKQGTIQINGQVIPIAITPATFRLYKKAFKREFWVDMVIECNRTEETYNVPETERRILQFAWAFAKTADPSIPNMQSWVKQFNDVPPLDILKEIEKVMILYGTG